MSRPSRADRIKALLDDPNVELPEESPGAGRGGCGRFLLIGLVVAGALAWALYGYVPMEAVVLLSLWGGTLIMFGASLLVESSTRAKITAVVLIVLSAYSLLPRAPREWIVEVPLGGLILEARDAHFAELVERGDLEGIRRVGALGLEELQPRGSFETPLVETVEDPEILAAVLAAGIDPDIRDKEGRTVLMNVRDPALARVLLEAGADPDLGDDTGLTALMYASGKGPEMVEVLLDGGASPGARDDLGRGVLDFFSAGDPALAPLEERGLLSATPAEGATRAGHREWLVITGNPTADAATPLPESSITSEAQIFHYGDVVRLEINYSNPTPEPRVLMVEAHLGVAALFVGASSGGRPALPAEAVVNREVRWPQLALPGHSAGRLELDVVTRSSSDAGDLVVDASAFDLRSTWQEALNFYRPLTFPPTDSGPASWLWLVFAVTFLLCLGGFIGTFGKPPRARLNRLCVLGIAALLGFVTYAMVVEEIRPYQHRETTCQVLDLRVARTTTTDSSSSSSSTRSRSRTSYSPLLAVSFQGEDRGEVIATGRGNLGEVESLERFAIGSEIPCWVDDEEGRFAVRRGPTVGETILLLFFAAVSIGLGLWALRTWPSGPSTVL